MLARPPYLQQPVLSGAGCRVQGAGCKAQGAGCRMQASGCRVQGAGCARPPATPSASRPARESCFRPWRVANRATLPQKWPATPRHVAGSCQWTEATKLKQPSIFHGRAVHNAGCKILTCSPARHTFRMPSCPVPGAGFRDQNAGFKVQGCIVQGSGLRVEG